MLKRMKTPISDNSTEANFFKDYKEIIDNMIDN